MNTTVNENPPLARQGQMIHDGTKTNAEKDHDHENHKRKEIRRDSKTGFEKFEDYFDSDSDNTTLKGNNVTTANDSTEDKGNRYILLELNIVASFFSMFFLVEITFLITFFFH